MAAVDAMDAEGGTALTAPQLLSDACNHCVVVVDTLASLASQVEDEVVRTLLFRGGSGAVKELCLLGASQRE